MKKLLRAVLGGLLAGGLLALSMPAFAAQPTNINYAGKGVTFRGDKYRIYTVRCSNGTKRKITKWKKRKKKKPWCVGKASTKSCSKQQLKAAAKACR
ncbi:MAG: hypothetical protein GY862_12210 [Gammaproteobacteria bacterium]|nr:hypothetical protein [Gammaproteobacteria bacterium]